jgi:uncharacterized surface protein with fasciclin (FAS1) repeats
VPIRRAATLIVATVAILCAACSDDDAGDGGSTTPSASSALVTSAPVTSAPTATTAGSPSVPPPRTTMTAAGPTGPACARLPDNGEGSLAAIADEPAGTAMSHVPVLSSIVAAIDAAGLLNDLDGLDGQGPLTIFAPVNAAFDAIPPADLEAMLTDTNALNSILLYHAVAGERLSSAELADARKVATIEGQDLTFARTRGRLSINRGQASVVCADIPTANATIHLIDGLLMPPAAEDDLVSGTMLYSVDLTSGAATRIGPIGDELGVIGLAVAPADDLSTVYGLTDVPELITFDAADPATIAARVPVTGVAPGSSLLAIDVRPASGQLVGLSDASVLYTIDPASGAATAVGTGFDPPLQDPGFGFDVDPAADRIRVDVATGQNLSVDPTTGEATAGGALAYERGDPNAAATPRVVAAAYTEDGNLFAVDVAAGVLAHQAPADAGTLATIGPLGVNLTDGASFDIATSGEALLASPG